MSLQLVLFNGSKTPKAWDPRSPHYVDNWKPEQRIIKNVKEVLVTYGSVGDVKVLFNDDTSAWYAWHKDLLVVDGIYYGDFAVNEETP